MREAAMAIRRATAADAQPLAELVRRLEGFDWLRDEPGEDTTGRVADHLALCLADGSHSLYVAEASGRLAGYVSVHWLPYLILRGPEGYVSELFLAPDARGQGIGTQLIETVVAEARARGCYRLQLINSRARESYRRDYYRKRGWEEREQMASFVLMLR